MEFHQNELFKSDAPRLEDPWTRERDPPFRDEPRRVDASRPRAQVNPVVAGVMTGGLFKSGAGPRGAALAAVIGGGLAAVSHFTPGLK